MMYKRIMVAVDESVMTEQVLAAAIELAKANAAQMAICHAIDETILARREVAMMLPNSVGKTEARLRLAAQSFLSRLAERARVAGVEAEVTLMESDQKHVSDMLVEAAEAWSADLLVVGTHGHRGIERYFVGSVAERLVRKAKTSILLVRGEEHTE